MKKFCILATQRSGSTWLMDSIQRSVHSRGIFAELFLDQPAQSPDPWSEPQGNLEPPVRYYDWRKTSGAFLLIAPRLYLAFLELYAQKEPYFGFKIMCNQLVKKPWLASLLRQGGYSVLHLKRKNLLDVYISVQNLQMAQPHLRLDDLKTARDYDPIRLDPVVVYRTIRGLIRREKMAESIIKLFGISMETVEYNRLADGDKNEIERLDRFIGQPIDLFSQQGLQKLSKKNTPQKITNYEEVISYLKKKGLDTSYYT